MADVEDHHKPHHLRRTNFKLWAAVPHARNDAIREVFMQVNFKECPYTGTRIAERKHSKVRRWFEYELSSREVSIFGAAQMSDATGVDVNCSLYRLDATRSTPTTQTALLIFTQLSITLTLVCQTILGGTLIFDVGGRSMKEPRASRATGKEVQCQ